MGFVTNENGNEMINDMLEAGVKGIKIIDGDKIYEAGPGSWNMGGRNR